MDRDDGAYFSDLPSAAWRSAGFDLGFELRSDRARLGFTSVPEASTYGAISAAGLLVLALVRRRRAPDK